MLKKIKNLKVKAIIGVVVLCVIFISLTTYFIVSNIKLNNKINTLMLYNLKLGSKINTVDLIDDNNFQNILEKKTGLVINIPDTWSIDNSYVRYIKTDRLETYGYEFRIVLNMDDNYTFDDFANNIFEQARSIANDCHESKLESWKDKGYYLVNYFNETTNGNIYFDRKDFSDESLCIRHKVKLTKNNNQLIVEVDIF